MDREEFNKLQQSGTLDEFLGRFEDLKAKILICNLALNNTHFLSCFIGALKEEIRFEVKMFKLTKLKEVVQKARMKEMTIEAVHKRRKGVNRLVTPVVQGMGNTGSTATGNRTYPYQLTPEVFEFSKSNYLCFYCGEKYGLEHLCKAR